ncbi:MAG: hypothetical protein ABIR46_00185 [Candidatus Saccharimonadales bacterium]
MNDREVDSFECTHGHTLTTASGLAEAYATKCFGFTQLSTLVAKLPNTELVVAISYVVRSDLDPEYMRENGFEPDKLSREEILVRLAMEGVITQEAMWSYVLRLKTLG